MSRDVIRSKRGWWTKERKHLLSRKLGVRNKNAKKHERKPHSVTFTFVKTTTDHVKVFTANWRSIRQLSSWYWLLIFGYQINQKFINCCYVTLRYVMLLRPLLAARKWKETAPSLPCCGGCLRRAAHNDDYAHAQKNIAMASLIGYHHSCVATQALHYEHLWYHKIYQEQPLTPTTPNTWRDAVAASAMQLLPLPSPRAGNHLSWYNMLGMTSFLASRFYYMYVQQHCSVIATVQTGVRKICVRVV